MEESANSSKPSLIDGLDAAQSSASAKQPRKRSIASERQPIGRVAAFIDGHLVSINVGTEKGLMPYDELKTASGVMMEVRHLGPNSAICHVFDIRGVSTDDEVFWHMPRGGF